MLNMRTNEAVGWSGLIRVEVYNAAGLVEAVEFPNLITDAGLDLIRDAYLSFTDRSEPEFMAFGSDSTPPADGDTTLGAEFGRVPITDRTAAGTGVAETRAIINSIQGVAPPTIEELGWFADADDDVDSGILIARVLYTRAKTNLESILVTRTDTFGRL